MPPAAERHHGGDGPPLLLVHPAFATWRAWAPAVPHLERSFEVLAPTLVGHFEGPPLPPGTEMGLRAAADGLERELDARGWDTAHVAGCSFGGVLALELARRGRARSAVALSPGGDFRRLGPLARRRIAVVLWLTGVLGRRALPLADRLCGSALGRRIVFAQASAHPARLDPEDAANVFRATVQCPTYRELLRASLRDDPPPFEEIRSPVLVAWGSRDRLLPYRLYAGPLRDALRGAEFRTLHGVGHLAMLDDPRGIAALVRDFARRTEQAAPSASNFAHADGSFDWSTTEGGAR